MKPQSKAEARLEAVLRRARAAGDVEAWMSAQRTLYEVSRRQRPEKLAALRSSLREEADGLRLRYRSRIGRLWVAQQLDEWLGDLLREELMSGPDSSTAFQAIEGMKARGLLDQFSLRFRDLRDEAAVGEAVRLERELLRFEVSEKSDLSWFELLLSSHLPVIPSRDSGRRIQTLSQLERLYGDHQAGFSEVQAVASLRQVQAALSEDEALIQYAIPYHWSHPSMALWILAVTREKVLLLEAPMEILAGSGFIGRLAVDDKQPIDAGPLTDAVWTLRMAIQRRDDRQAQRRLELLHGLLVAPLEAAGVQPRDFARWIICPHGALHHLPWGALCDPKGVYLVEKTSLALVPSASIWLRMASHSRKSPPSFLGLANPILEDTGLPPLEASAREVKKIARKLKDLDAKTLVGAEATETSLREYAPGRAIVHLATHGEFPELNPMDLHRLLLTADDRHDGHVRADELRRLDLKSAWLAVLSICNGGLQRLGPGDEPYGIIPALICAGAANVVSTLWPLEDRKGREFMVDFYDRLLDSGPAEALRRAALRRVGRTPLEFWAGFLLVGGGRRTVGESD